MQRKGCGQHGDKGQRMSREGGGGSNIDKMVVALGGGGDNPAPDHPCHVIPSKGLRLSEALSSGL